MQKTSMSNKHFVKLAPFHKKDIFCLLAILFVCIGVFFSGAVLFLPKATSISQREIINDEYNTTTPALTGQDTLTQTIYAEGDLYGVVLNVTTFNKIVHGTVNISLIDSQNHILATSSADMSTLLDNTFHRFLFNQKITASTNEPYTLQITTVPDTQEDIIGFWQSGQAVSGYTENPETSPHYAVSDFSLAINGEPIAGTLALQYTTQYAGNFIVGAYSFFAAFLTVLLLFLYWCFFIQKIAIHKTFLVASLCLGFVFTLLIPFRTAPDEYAHIATSYHYSNVLLGQAELDEAGTVTVRNGDQMKLDNYDYSATNIFAYKQIAEGLTAKTPTGAPTAIPARTLTVFPLLFAAPTLGISLARILGLNQTWLLLLGRLANLLFFSIVVSRAIKKMPFAKPLLFCIALLPSTLQLAASFCYDTYLLAIVFYFIATILHYTYTNQSITIKSVIWIAILAALLAPAKAIYFLLVILIFMIPSAKYPNKKFRFISQGAIICTVLLVWGITNFSTVQTSLYPTTPADALNTTNTITQIGANGDSLQFFTPSYILTHISQTIKLVLLTVYEQSSLWLQGLLGGRLGEIIAIEIELNWVLVIGLLLVTLLATLPDEKDTSILSTSNRWLSFGLFVSISALAVLACITWTPSNYDTIFGVQGRYFLPVLPLALLALRGQNLQFKKPAKNILLFSMVALVILCQLNAFFIIIAR